MKDSERVTWVEDRSGKGRAETGGVLATGFQQSTAGTAAGVLAMGNDVWFACVPDLVRLRSSSASGAADQRETVLTGFGVHIGVSGHDLHGLKKGPDGRLYFSMGDRGFSLPETARRGPARPGWTFPLQQPDTGAILRCEPDGSHLEVFAIGVRNPQELTFDDAGNLWTGDNDTAGADDSRLLYLVEGGDYGWRCSYQHQTGFGPWVQEDFWKGGIDDLLPTSGVVAQGPSGLDYYPGTGFGESLRGHFLMCDFPGGIWNFTVTPSGAGFRLGTREKLVWGLWPTDVEFGPDGAAYAADWVFGWEKPDKGRIYRVADARFEGDALVLQTRKLLAEGLEVASETRLGELLGHPDQRVRLRAQWKLAALLDAGIPVFQSALQNATSSWPRLHSLWGLGQIGRHSATATAAAERATALIVARLTDSNPEIRAQAAKLSGELAAGSSASGLMKGLSDSDSRVRFFSAISLGRLGPRSDLEPLLVLLRENADRDPFLRHAGIMALLGMTDLKGLIALGKSDSLAVRRASLLAMRRLARPETAGYLNDVQAELAAAAARAINDVPIVPALPELAAFLGKVDCPTQIVSRAINANLRVGGDRNTTVLASFAARRDVAEGQRVMALEALSEWAQPAPLDRIVGLWRPLNPRTPEPARRALRAAAPGLFSLRSEWVAIAALKAAARLRIKEVGHGAFELMQQSNATAEVRIEVLRTLASLKHSRWPEALQAGLSDRTPAVRAEALVLAAEDPQGDIFDGVISLLAESNPMSVRQTALRVLSQLSDSRADRLLLEWVSREKSGAAPPELSLDILEAAARRTDPAVVTALGGTAVLSASPRFPEDYQALLYGGDGARGKTLFTEKAETACLRCHRVAGTGGPGGPVLDGLGKRAQRLEILESILRPNARIATGFNQVLIETKSGVTHAGVVKSETTADLVLQTLDAGTITLSLAEIESRVVGPSAMPEGLDKLLSRRELRDLVEFLASLK